MSDESLLRAVTANKTDALGDFGNGVIPVVLVFDGNVPREPLRLQFIEHGGNVRHAGAVGHIVRLRALLIQVLHVTADDVSLEDPQAFNGLKPGAHPMPDIRAGTDAGVAIFHHGKNVIWVPHLVIRIVRALAVVS